MNDTEYMQLALQYAKKGEGWVAPNPMVGAVIVKEGRVIGAGWHQKCGEPHAERNALASCSESPRGATMYVTLEPCCHQGRQPPCTEAILKAQIGRVVTGALDPNPLVAGGGIRMLREHGVAVTEHILKEECEKLNEIFFHYIGTNRPFVVMKYAMTMDGKIAAYTGASKWITGAAALEHVQAQRNRYTAIMVGVGTVLADDPMLSCRMPGGKNPVRILCDTNLRTPLTAQTVATANQIRTIIATCCTDEMKKDAYRHMGCEILTIQKRDGRLDLLQLMEKLGQQQIDSILLEGGGTLNWAALECGIVQKVQTYIAPKLFGGQEAKTPVEGAGVSAPSKAFLLKNSKMTKLGDDFLIESEVDWHVYRDCGGNRDNRADL